MGKAGEFPFRHASSGFMNLSPLYDNKPKEEFSRPMRLAS